MCVRQDIRTYGLSITGINEIQGRIWITCPSTFLFYATHTRRMGVIYVTGVVHIYEIAVDEGYSFDYALSAIESDIEYWSEPDRYRSLIDGLVMADPTKMANKGNWN